VTFTFLILILLTLRIPKPNQVNSISRNDISDDNIDDKRWVEIISWEPRAFIHHNFLTKEECEHIINIAKPHMRKSAVVDNITGKSLNSSGRTSSGTFLARGRDQIVRNIEKRIADITFIPVEHGENLNVLHYEVGQKYDSHLDYFMDKFSTKNGGQRIATMLMYL
jgi:prolyl 4-hydroxylase